MNAPISTPPLFDWQQELARVLSETFETQQLTDALALEENAGLHLVVCGLPWIVPVLADHLRERLSVLPFHLDPFREHAECSAPITFNELLRTVGEPLATLKERVEPLTPVLLDASASLQRDQSAWEQLLHRINQQRNTLLRELPGPLIFVLPPWMERVVANAAPDFWSVRRDAYSLQEALKEHAARSAGTEKEVPFSERVQQQVLRNALTDQGPERIARLEITEHEAKRRGALTTALRLQEELLLLLRAQRARSKRDTFHQQKFRDELFTSMILWLEAGNIEGATQRAREFASYFPNNPHLSFFALELCFAEGRLAQAEEWLKSAQSTLQSDEELEEEQRVVLHQSLEFSSAMLPFLRGFWTEAERSLRRQQNDMLRSAAPNTDLLWLGCAYVRTSIALLRNSPEEALQIAISTGKQADELSGRGGRRFKFERDRMMLALLEAEAHQEQGSAAIARSLAEDVVRWMDATYSSDPHPENLSHRIEARRRWAKIARLQQDATMQERALEGCLPQAREQLAQGPSIVSYRIRLAEVLLEHAHLFLANNKSQEAQAARDEVVLHSEAVLAAAPDYNEAQRIRLEAMQLSCSP